MRPLEIAGRERRIERGVTLCDLIVVGQTLTCGLVGIHDCAQRNAKSSQRLGVDCRNMSRTDEASPALIVRVCHYGLRDGPADRVRGGDMGLALAMQWWRKMSGASTARMVASNEID